MRFSNTPTLFLLLSATGQLATQYAMSVSAKSTIRHSNQNFLRTTLRSGALEDSTSDLRRRERRRRFLEENEGEVDDANSYQDDDGSSAIDKGYIAAHQCSSFKIQESDDSYIDVVLKWNLAYGNGLDVFRVAQKSYVFYDYVDPTNRNNNDRNYDIRRDSSYVIDLDSWIQTSATVGLGQGTYPSCRQIYNAQEVFQTNNDENDEITKFFDTVNLQYNNYFGDWDPQLYIGPVCGMGDDTINWGIFLDNTCTTYVPKWTYRYRDALAKGHISYSSTTKTLAKLSGHTTPKHHWSCKNGNGLCDTLLSYSADTLYCQVQGEDQDKDRRRVEQDVDDDTTANDDYFVNGYQISQEDLEDIGTECEAVVSAYAYGQGTLEEYLEHHGQLKHTKDYKKGTRSIIESSVLALLLFGVVVSATMVFKRRKQRKQIQQTQSAKPEVERSNSEKKIKRNRSNSREIKRSASQTSTKQKRKGKAAPKDKKGKEASKKRGSWFSGFGRKNTRDNHKGDKKQRLLESGDL